MRRYCSTKVVSNRLELVAKMSLVFTDVPQGISMLYVFCISICIPVTQRINSCVLLCDAQVSTLRWKL